MHKGFEKVLTEYDNLQQKIEAQWLFIQVQYNINADEITIIDRGNATQQSLNQQIKKSRETQITLRTAGQFAVLLANALAEFLPTDVGLSVDATAPARGAIRLAGTIISQATTTAAAIESLGELDDQQAKEAAQAAHNLELTTLRQELPILQQ